MNARSHPELANLSFLVVEDHGFQRWALADLLTRLGAANVRMAADGKEALEMFCDAEHPVDIIVSDLDMPGMDGMEFLRHISETKSDVSVILTSSHDRQLLESVETMARAYGVHLLVALEKPATAAKLLAAIDMHRHRLASEPRPARSGEAFTLEQVLEGLERDEFEPFLQPKVEMSSRKVVGAEALARWRHPSRGLVAPREFVHVLEAAGRSEDLTAVMLRKAAIMCRAWQEAGRDATISVNLSAASLGDVKLADRMMAIVVSQDLAPRHVIFEVTESAMTMDLARSLENLSRLRMKGFGLSIDDYGTGYSSMQQLTRIPFTELKIDQSFVKNAVYHPASRAVLESSLEMAAKLKIPAVAEGVESHVEWDLVSSLGCRYAQGYHVARPAAASTFLEWLQGEG